MGRRGKGLQKKRQNGGEMRGSSDAAEQQSFPSPNTQPRCNCYANRSIELQPAVLERAANVLIVVKRARV
jgi:hypothetical protein